MLFFCILIHFPLVCSSQFLSSFYRPLSLPSLTTIVRVTIANSFILQLDHRSGELQ